MSNVRKHRRNKGTVRPFPFEMKLFPNVINIFELTY